jgi:hypothetical protein
MTSIANLDIHDIARTAACYGIESYTIISPDPLQREMVGRILDFWDTNDALLYNPDRREALARVTCQESIEALISQITSQEGLQPIVITTTAREIPGQISFGDLDSLCAGSRPALLLFGTGYGLAEEIHRSADYILMPIKGTGSYNHLSVRSAVAIVLDRITSENINGRNHGYSANNRQRPNQNRLSRLSRRRYGQGPL